MKRTMINFGFRKAKDMPEVYAELTLVDRILEGIAVLLIVAAWVLAIVFYIDSPSPSGRLFISPCVMLVFAAALIWASRASIRLYSFPVKLDERNYVMQYLIATFFVRVFLIVGSLILFWSLCIEIEPQLGVDPGLFLILSHATAGLLALSFIGYYIFAFYFR